MLIFILSPLTTLVVIYTDCTDSCKSNYHTITTTMSPGIKGDKIKINIIHWIINPYSYFIAFWSVMNKERRHVDWLISHEQGKKTCWLVDQSWTRKEDMLIGWSVMNKERRHVDWLISHERHNLVLLSLFMTYQPINLSSFLAHELSTNQHVFFPCSWLINQSTCLLSLFMTDQPINMWHRHAAHVKNQTIRLSIAMLICW
jgi:hypothetical protein